MIVRRDRSRRTRARARSRPARWRAARRGGVTVSTMNVGFSAPWSRFEYPPLISTGMSVLHPVGDRFAHASGKTSTSEDPEKSSTVNRANSAPDFLVICCLIAVTTTPSVIGRRVQVPSSATVCVANSSHSARNGSSGMPRDVEAEDLLLLLQPLGLGPAARRRELGWSCRASCVSPSAAPDRRRASPARWPSPPASATASASRRRAPSRTARDGRRGRRARRRRSAPRRRACCTSAGRRARRGRRAT